MWSGHRLLWHDRHHPYQERIDSSREEKRTSRHSDIQMLLKTSGVPKAWQNSMVDRHIHDAFHFDRAKVYQKLTIWNTKIHGDVAQIQWVVREQSEGIVGQSSRFLTYKHKGLRKADWMPAKSPHSYGDCLGVIRRAIRDISKKNIPRRQ